MTNFLGTASRKFNNFEKLSANSTRSFGVTVSYAFEGHNDFEFYTIPVAFNLMFSPDRSLI